MITVVSRWEQTQMPAEYEFKMWRQLKVFGITRFIFTPKLLNNGVEEYDTMEECLAQLDPKLPRCFLEPTGYKDMYDLAQVRGPIALILGSTTNHNMMHADIDETYRIHEPAKSDMYPTSAAAIALAFRYGQ